MNPLPPKFTRNFLRKMWVHYASQYGNTCVAITIFILKRQVKAGKIKLHLVSPRLPCTHAHGFNGSYTATATTALCRGIMAYMAALIAWTYYNTFACEQIPYTLVWMDNHTSSANRANLWFKKEKKKSKIWPTQVLSGTSCSAPFCQWHFNQRVNKFIHLWPRDSRA